MKFPKTAVLALPLLVVAGCASVPDGPSVAAMPGTGKSFDQFRADDYDCRGFASSQAGNPQDAQADSTVRSAALGTVVGALAGAAIGGGRGAGIGAGTGLLFGTAAGASEGNASAYSAQRRYDIAYTQCMYAKGDRVPVSGRMSSQNGYPPPPPPAPQGYYPPPPPPPAPPAPPGYTQ